eukprot:CAMPEP_0198691908 /NCGR_PEP_ID=MMETSP1468-20131203/214266_1 /TAXON_ID=1461545 /ORGANISM="Mantoniella sp, Strain CCMP1436" /LENGTH=74 /DNA_ID=CAMNT_0044445437 /DNA_START=128 /DNA_END=349 /DNA_ORIENTATION=-
MLLGSEVISSPSCNDGSQLMSLDHPTALPVCKIAENARVSGQQRNHWTGGVSRSVRLSALCDTPHEDEKDIKRV